MTWAYRVRINSPFFAVTDPTVEATHRSILGSGIGSGFNYEINNLNRQLVEVRASTDILTGTATLDDGLPKLIAVSRDGANNYNAYLYGAADGTGSNAFSYASGNMYLGSVNNVYFFDGKMAEVIVYNSVLSAADRNKVESYLAIKYGMTLDQTVATNYVSSDGTVIWGATTNSTHNNDIAGIGMDYDDVGLDQPRSRTIHTDSMITISNAADIDNLEFLVWGNDNGSLTVLSTEVPGGLPALADGRLTREWRVDETGDVGTVDIAIQLDQQTALVKSANAGDYALLIDDDGDFGNGGTTVHTTGAAINGTRLSFTGVNFSDGNYFTVVGPEPKAPGGIRPTLNVWLKANANAYSDAGSTLATDGSTVQEWHDQNLFDDNAVQITALDRPTYLDNTTDNINFNPVLNFDGLNQEMDFSNDLGLSGTNQFTIFAVTDPTVEATHRSILGSGIGSGFNYEINNLNRQLVEVRASTDILTGTATLDDGLPKLTAVSRNGANNYNAYLYGAADGNRFKCLQLCFQ